MKKTAGLLAALLVLVAAGTGLAADKTHAAAAGSDVTLTGEIVDLACYIGHGAAGSQHAGCAAKCAEMGQPIGLKASDGKLYLLVADHADTSGFTKAKTLAGKNVEVKGEAAAKDGVNSLTVHEVKAV